MAKILRDVWILTESGLTIFSRVKDSKLDPQVFGGLMSALNMFAQNLSEGGMSNFALSNIRFTLLKKNHLFFVSNSSNQVKSKKVLNELKIIAKRFFKEFSDEYIQNFNSNVRVFADFKHLINASLEEST